MAVGGGAQLSSAANFSCRAACLHLNCGGLLLGKRGGEGGLAMEELTEIERNKTLITSVANFPSKKSAGEPRKVAK